MTMSIEKVLATAKHSFILLAGTLCVASASAGYREPVLSWTIERVGSEQGRMERQFSQSSFDATQLQIKTLCDRAMADRMKWPQTEVVRITVRPLNSKPDDGGPMRTAEIKCEEIRTDPNALGAHIPKPKMPKSETKKLIQLWD